MNKFYDVLGVNSNISDIELKEVYFSLLKRYHPDTYLGDKDFASKKTAEINEAYTEITNFRAKHPVENEVKEQSKVTETVKEQKTVKQKDINYRKMPVENSAEAIVNQYKKGYSKAEKRAKAFLDFLIASLSIITIGLILFLIFYR